MPTPRRNTEPFNTIWATLLPTLVPQWDMTLREFELTHPAYPSIRVQGASEALVLEAYAQALAKLLA